MHCYTLYQNVIPIFTPKTTTLSELIPRFPAEQSRLGYTNICTRSMGAEEVQARAVLHW